MQVKVTMFMEISDDGFDSVKRIEHHVDDLMDLESWPEIKAVYGVSVEDNSRIKNPLPIEIDAFQAELISALGAIDHGVKAAAENRELIRMALSLGRKPEDIIHLIAFDK